MKSGKVYIGKNVDNLRGNGIYTTSNLECAKLFATHGNENIVQLPVDVNDLILKDKILSVKYLRIILACIYRNHKDELDFILKTPKDDLKFDSANTFASKIVSEFMSTGVKRNMKNFDVFSDKYIKDHAEEYEESQKNRIRYFKENKYAIFHNLGLQAKLLGYDVLYTDEYDDDLDIDIKEYLILKLFASKIRGLRAF